MSAEDDLPVQVDSALPIKVGELSGPHPAVVPPRRRWRLVLGVLGGVVLVGVTVGWWVAG